MESEENEVNKARLFVVDEETLQETVNSNIVSIFTPDLNGGQWLKTIADIMADMLQVEIGDYIFLWERKSASQKNRIHGVYRAISKPYYEMSIATDQYPFKIHIEPAFDFKNPLDEYDLLNCPYIKTPLWTIIGKKVAGKSRGTTPLSQDEASKLITLLIGKNPNYVYHPYNPANVNDVINPLRIDYGITGDNIQNPTLNTINPNHLCFFNDDYSIKYEKILETIFNQEMSSRNRGFFSQIGIDVDKVIWFCNYLPYSIEQSEMDYLIIESEDGNNLSKIFLIEFMKNRIDKPHIYRCLLYSKWVNETLALGEPIAQPIIICPDSYDFIVEERTPARQEKTRKMQKYISDTIASFSTKELQVYTYNFSGGHPSFSKKR